MKKLFLCLFVLAGTVLLHAQQSQAALDAPNLDFSERNFSHWERSLGTFHCDNPSAPENQKTYSYTWRTIGELEENERIDFLGDVNTLDPILQCDALYTNPDPGKMWHE